MISSVRPYPRTHGFLRLGRKRVDTITARRPRLVTSTISSSRFPTSERVRKCTTESTSCLVADSAETSHLPAALALVGRWSITAKWSTLRSWYIVELSTHFLHKRRSSSLESTHCRGGGSRQVLHFRTFQESRERRT